MSMNDFFTREKSGQGVKVPLFLPTGESTEDWLLIRGVDSDEFRIAQSRMFREMATLPSKGLNPEQLEVAHLEIKTMLQASLIISWSFPEECTDKVKYEFLRQAPQIADKIDKIATQRNLFFKNQSVGSVNTPD